MGHPETTFSKHKGIVIHIQNFDHVGQLVHYVGLQEYVWKIQSQILDI